MFAYPLRLFLLVVPAVLLWWVWARQTGRVALPFDHGTRRRPWGLAALLGVSESLAPMLLAVVIVILAGPQRLGQPREKRVLTNIEFCVDISGSMTAQFGEGTRYDASMEAIDRFLNYRKGDAFGLTFFGNNFLHWVPLTTDPSAIKCSPPFMRPESAPPGFGGTEIAKALLGCRDVLIEREEGDRMIVLISDGYSSDLDNGNDADVAARLKADNIVLYAVHVAETDIPGEIVNVAALTGGEVFQSADPVALATVFERIDQMQQTRMEKTASESHDDFPPYCIAGLALLGLCTATSFGLRYTPW